MIAGPNVSPGYLGPPDLTEGVFSRVDGVQAYRTGDLGRYADGWLYFEGRRDDQVKLHGYRIELGDVETNLRALAESAMRSCLPVSGNGLPAFLAAFVIRAGGRPAASWRPLTGFARSSARDCPRTWCRASCASWTASP